MKDESKSNKRDNFLSTVSRFIDDYKRPISYSFYLMGGAGVVILLKSARVFSQFKSFKDVPPEFLEKKMSIFCLVQSHSWTQLTTKSLKPVLKVEHLPIFGIGDHGGHGSQDVMAVSLKGVAVPVDMSARAKLWMDANLPSNTKVKVKLLSVENEAIEAIVHTKGWMLWRGCVGSRLVREGLAKVEEEGLAKVEEEGLAKVEDAHKDPQCSYIRKLRKAEDLSRREGKGLWQGEEMVRWKRWRRWFKSFL